MNDPVYQWQCDVFGRLKCAAYLADVSVNLDEKGVTPDDVAQALNFATDGKLGAGIFVGRPVRQVPHPDASGPEFDLVIPVGIVEAPDINRTEQGSRKTIESLASFVCSLLHGWRPNPNCGDLYCDKSAVEPVFDDADGLLKCEAYFRTRLKFASVPRVLMPVIAGDSSLLQLSTATPGAAIYFTADGTFPGPSNAAAQVYSAPLTNLTPGTLVRAGAFKPDTHQGSDLAAAIIQ